jgi:chemotaxis protein MotB
MFSTKRRMNRDDDIWPGFVDALATLLMVVIFIITFFGIAQVYLSHTVENQNVSLKKFELQNQEIASRLKILQDKIQGLNLVKSTLETKNVDLETLLTLKNQEFETLSNRVQELLNKMNILQSESVQEKKTAQTERNEKENFQNQLQDSEVKLSELTEKLLLLSSHLDQAQVMIRDKDQKIELLDVQLQKKMAEELSALKKYQSVFLQKMQDALSDRKDIRVEGDRFIFQSEVLFPLGAADLDEGGKKNLQKVASALKDIMKTIPTNFNWILQIDGHTDKLQVRHKFKSNWHLSTERALSVVDYFIEQGIPPERLAATGFGEFHPLDAETTPEAYGKNRRIEMKLTTR